MTDVGPQPTFPPKFKLATTNDAEALVAVEIQIGQHRTYGLPISLDSARNVIRDSALYFISIGDLVVGTAAHRTRIDGSVYLSNIAIIPDYRGHGVGRAAMNFLLGMSGDARRIDLVTHPENKAALRLYASFGFEVEVRKEDYFGDGEPRLVLAKVLAAKTAR